MKRKNNVLPFHKVDEIAQYNADTSGPFMPLWIEEIGQKEVWCVALQRPSSTTGALLNHFYASYFGSTARDVFVADDYGSIWRCWENNPTKKERNTASWKE